MSQKPQATRVKKWAKIEAKAFADPQTANKVIWSHGAAIGQATALAHRIGASNFPAIEKEQLIAQLAEKSGVAVRKLTKEMRKAEPHLTPEYQEQEQ
jgi:hypothetical protein